MFRSFTYFDFFRGKADVFSAGFLLLWSESQGIVAGLFGTPSGLVPKRNLFWQGARNKSPTTPEESPTYARFCREALYRSE